MSIRKQAVVWTAVGVAVFAVTFGLYLGRPVNRTDEAWMLWLMHRLARGDVLYRDAYDVTTPMAAWIGGASAWALGDQVAVLRGLVAASFAGQVVVACSIVRRCGFRWPGCAVLAVTLIAIGSPLAAFTSFYSSLAVLGALLTLRAVLWWYDRRDAGAPTDAALIAIGFAVAFSFWCKPNVGVLVYLAAVVSIAIGLVRERGRILRDLAVMTGALAALSAVVMAVIALTGAWSAFIDQVFLSKRQYVDIGFSYEFALRHRLSELVHGAYTDLRSLLQLSVLATPVIIVTALAWGCWRHRRSTDMRYIALVAFAVAGLLSVFPRPGVNHFVGTMPLTLTATVSVWALAPRRLTVRSSVRWLVVAAAATFALLGMSVVAGDSVQSYQSARLGHDFPHFRMTPIPRELRDRTHALRAGLRQHTNGSVFIAREDAGFLYFETGTHNPLPYDMVERSDFGGGGERGVIRQLKGSGVEYVCLHPQRPPKREANPLVPKTLERWVRAHYTRVSSYPACDLYRAVAGSVTGPRA